MKCIKSKSFANGHVYALALDDNYPIEVTDTWLPSYTKDAVGRKTNKLNTLDSADRSHRWMIGVSCMSGCPVGCKFCATAKLKKWRPLTAEEIVAQVLWVINKSNSNPADSKEFKINYTRMGEPFLNITAIRKAISILDAMFPEVTIHHYISTIGVQSADFSWIKDNITLQVSLHSTDEVRRKALIPFKKLMTIEQLGQIRTSSWLKTTINMTLVDSADFSISKLKDVFAIDKFFVKLSPINENEVSKTNDLGAGIIHSTNIL